MEHDSKTTKQQKFTYHFKEAETAKKALEAITGYLVATYFGMEAVINVSRSKDTHIKNKLTLTYISDDDIRGSLKRICKFYDDFRSELTIDFTEKWGGL